MRRLTLKELGFALLFSIPPGIGLMGFLMQLTRSPPTGIVGGVIGFLVLFSLMYLIIVSGPDEEEDSGEFTLGEKPSKNKENGEGLKKEKKKEEEKQKEDS